MKKNCWLRAITVCASALALSATAMAETEFSGSGFLTLAAGKILGGTRDEPVELGYHGPVFIADYAQGGVYENRGWMAEPDSKLGLQGTAKFVGTPWSVTGQVVARGARGGRTNLEWIYASYQASDQLTLQVGRKRIPFFYYSDSQDVGVAYPWVHLPPQMYGWEVVNYNGVSAMYRDQIGSWTSALNVFAGGEHRSQLGYQEIYWGKNAQSETRWKDLVGAELNLSRDWLETRLLYLQAKTAGYQRLDPAFENPPGVPLENGDMGAYTMRKTYGVSVAADYQNWVARAEFLYQNSYKDYGKDFAQLYALGYRIGKFLPLISYSNYKQQLSEFANPIAFPSAEGHSTTSYVLRYDLTTSSALKAQYDYWRDKSKAGFGSVHGDARLISFSYDTVF